MNDIKYMKIMQVCKNIIKIFSSLMYNLFTRILLTYIIKINFQYI